MGWVGCVIGGDGSGDPLLEAGFDGGAYGERIPDGDPDHLWSKEVRWRRLLHEMEDRASEAQGATGALEASLWNAKGLHDAAGSARKAAQRAVLRGDLTAARKGAADATGAREGLERLLTDKDANGRTVEEEIGLLRKRLEDATDDLDEQYRRDEIDGRDKYTRETVIAARGVENLRKAIEAELEKAKKLLAQVQDKIADARRYEAQAGRAVEMIER